MEFIQAAQHGPADNYPIMRVVMHGTVSPCEPGGAKAIATYFSQTSRSASTQYVVGPDATYQCVKDSVIAYGAPPNKGSIHVELTDPQAGSPSRWSDANHTAMLQRAATLVASVCLKYDIPILKIGPADLLAGRKGICGHADVSNAWHQTDHVDPGPDFPWSQFLTLVRQAANPTPAPSAQEGKVQAYASLTTGPKAGAIYITDFIYRRWVPSNDYKVKQIAAGVDPTVWPFQTEAGLTAFAGPLAPGSDDYTPEVTP